MGVSENWGYLIRGPQNKDYCILGSVLGSPYFRKLPNLHAKADACTRSCTLRGTEVISGWIAPSVAHLLTHDDEDLPVTPLGGVSLGLGVGVRIHGVRICREEKDFECTVRVLILSCVS